MSNDDDSGVFYSIKGVVNKQPVELVLGVKVLIIMLIDFGVIHWTGGQVADVLLAVEVVLGLFYVKAKMTNNAKLDEVADATSRLVSVTAQQTAQVAAGQAAQAATQAVKDTIVQATKRARPLRADK